MISLPACRDLPDLVPVRMLNEFAYCPRLAYLEWVQGEWADNLDTLQGTFGHRNVDHPSCAEVPAPGTGQPVAAEAAPHDGQPAERHAPLPDPIHARSLALSAPAEGLTARIDLVEIDGVVATPVEYKRGVAPNLPEGAYEPERVQLCAQALILRENGFACNAGVIYYIASRQRVTIAIDEALVARTRELLAKMREVAAQRRLPPPLIDSPKCPRCSLVGICLPDETNFLVQLQGSWAGQSEANQPGDQASRTDQAAAARELSAVRRLLPQSDDALPLYLQDYGLTLSKSGEQLIVKKKGQTVQNVRLLDVSQVCLFGNVTLTEPALRELAMRQVPVCHYSYGGWFYALTTGLVHKNVELRIAQFAAAAEPAQALRLARCFIAGKIRNCRTLLRRHLPQQGKELLLFQLADYARKAEEAQSAETLLGLEGVAARLYFSGFSRLLSGGHDFQIEGRNRRPPRDPVNALLSFAYALLTKDLTITLQSVGFDPMLGLYHQPRYGRPSLALDLAEEFRPLIADSTVLTVINNGEVTSGSFVRRAGAVAMTEAGRRALMSAYERRLSTEITHPIFGYKISYRRVLEVQARLLARTLLGELPEYPSFQTR